MSIDAVASDRFEVTIQHDDSINSIYRNISEPAVVVGQKVERGHTLGRVSPQGNRGGLHFEILAGSEPVDPLRYLPATSPDPVLVEAESTTCPSSVLAVDWASAMTITFSMDSLRGYAIKEASVKTVEGNAQQEIDVRPKGQSSLLIAVGPRTAADSGDAIFVLQTVFSKGSDLRSVTCRLSLVSASVIPAVSNPESSNESLETPTPAVTPALLTVTSSPVALKTSTKTPVRSATLTARTGTPKPKTSVPGTPKSGTPTSSKSGTPAISTGKPSSQLAGKPK